MNVIKVSLQTWFHNWNHIFHQKGKIDQVWELTTTTRILGIPIWKKYHEVRCTCGKLFYKEEPKKEKL